jgi:hypothetical protein
MEKVDLEYMHRYGTLLTPIVEVAALLGVNELQLQEEMDNRNSPIRKAYMKGLAETGEELRSQMIEAVHAGSPSATEQALTALHHCYKDL